MSFLTVKDKRSLKPENLTVDKQCIQRKIFFWLCHATCPWLGTEPVPPAVEARSPNHWTARGVPQRKILIKRGRCKIWINRNLNTIGRPEEGALTPFKDSRAQQEEEKVLFFPGEDSANEKLWTLCLLQPSQLPFPPYKAFSFACYAGELALGSSWSQTPNSNSLLIPNKPVFAGEISGSLFISGQH